ncbi:helix-turn-helix domain-containing protein [Devosia elaeis]|uniref:helix-turn-helix domain-containing protein n=1 Tax=Devosia elaeis TaxID=1770058 RepID=UPI0013F4F5E6|nr:helix-turn-helix transcriptional regulator [Devosia elaeis]
MKSDADHTFVRRMEQLVEMAGGRGQLAAKSGLSRSVIDKYLQGASEPSRPRLVALAGAGPVSVAWLATGKGEMSAEPRAADDDGAHELDKWLFSRVIDGIRRTYEKVGGRLQTVNEVELGLEMYHRIVAVAETQDEQRGALLMALDQLERELLEKGRRAASGKQSA